jgi:hypothetical protein
MRDVAAGKTVKPAEAYHARVKLAKGGVLDLRAAPAATPTATPNPSPAPVPAVKSAPKPDHIAIHAPNLHTPAKTQAEVPAGYAPDVRRHRVQKRMEEAGKVERSSSISRFSATTATPLAPPAAPAPEPAQSPILTNHIAAQHAHLSRLLELSGETEHAQKKPATKPTRTNFAAAAVAVAIIGGYIWFHNYPHLAITSAADKAGFSASLPNFVPSSYNLSGPVSYAPGLVTLNFTSPSFKDQLKVTQQPTTWDSSSLLDNFVAQKSSTYSTVQGQGLTIYLFDNGQQAAWVNQGIWYSVVGASHLGRDQLLKMAYSF